MAYKTCRFYIDEVHVVNLLNSGELVTTAFRGSTVLTSQLKMFRLPEVFCNCSIPAYLSQHAAIVCLCGSNILIVVAGGKNVSGFHIEPVIAFRESDEKL